MYVGIQYMVYYVCVEYIYSVYTKCKHTLDAPPHAHTHVYV